MEDNSHRTDYRIGAQGRGYAQAGVS